MQEFFIIAGVAGECPVIHVIDHIDDGIEEFHVVGHENKAVLVIQQIFFQPCDMLRIQIVGGLVQNQNGRVLEQKLRQKHLGALAAAQIRHILIQADGSKTQPVGNFFDLGVKGIKTAVLQDMLELAGVLQHFFDVGALGGHGVIKGQHLSLQVKHMLKGLPQGVPDGHSFFEGGMLVQVAHRYALGPFDPAFVRGQLAGYDIQKSGLSFPVCADEPDVLALQQPEGSVLQYSPAPKTMGDIFYSQ